MPIRRVVALAALALLVAGSARADASPSASLSWVRLPGAEACISGPRLAALVEERLGRGALVPIAGAELGIEGRITRADGAWKATLVLTHRDGGVLGTRELAKTADTCASIDADLALVLAVMIDPDAALAGPPPATSPAAPPPDSPVAPAAPTSDPSKSGAVPSPAPPIAPRPPPSAAPAPSQRPPAPAGPVAVVPWRARMSLGPAVSLGMVPFFGAGAALRVAVTPPRLWAFEAGALFTAPSRDTTQAGIGADLSLALGRLSACPLVGARDAWTFAACAGAEAGAVRGRGVGLPIVLDQSQWVVNAVLHGSVERRVAGPVFAAASLGIGASIVRARFFYDAAGGAERDLFVTSPVVGWADLSLGIGLP